MTRRATVESWNALSPAYRARLERSGYTRADYLAGQSRQAARGHGSTPERPSRVRGREDQYREYIQRQTTRISSARRRALFDKTREWMITDIAAGLINRFDFPEVEFGIGNMPSVAFLNAERMTPEEWKQTASFAAGRMTPEQRDAMLAEWEYGVYDDESGHWINPFWYH